MLVVCAATGAFAGRGAQMRNLKAKSEKVLTVEDMYNQQVTILFAPVLLRMDESCQK